MGRRSTWFARSIVVVLAPLLAHCGSPSRPSAEPVAAVPAVPSGFPAGWPHVPPPPVVAEHGVVVTDAALATRAGLEVLASGGNAVDAAVATALALAVVYPAAGNLGGGGFLVARVGGVPHALDFRETAPAGATRDLYVGPDGEVTTAVREGHRASGVPGSVAGLYAAWRHLGSKKKTWPELVAPALRYARDGFPVDGAFAHMIDQAKARLAKHPASAALFLPSGEPPVVGALFRNADLAAVLGRIAEEGPKGFYEGPTAELIELEMKRGGGLITKADLASYRAKFRTPLEFSYRGRRIFSMPPPSSGGVTLAMLSRISEQFDMRKFGWLTADDYHVRAEAMRRAFAARNARLGDPDFVKNPLDELLSETWAKQQAETIRLDRATSSAAIDAAPPSGGAGPHTTHLSVVDAQGNAAALTTTINWWFGSGVTVTGGGFLLNNEMDDFASKPGTANGFGLVQGEPNAIAPGKRMLSSMSPTIVLGADGRVELVLGAAGGPTIISSVFGILSGVIDHGATLTEAVCAPRIHHQHLPDAIVFEKNGFSETVRRSLEGKGHVLKERDHIADAPAAGRHPAGGWVGAPEPRRKGTLAAGW